MDKIDLRYQRGKIYTVRCYDDDTAIYVGSTIQPLSARMTRHRTDNLCSLYKYVNGNWDNWYIELYEEYPCNNKQILEKREGEVIRLIGNINKCIAGRTKQEWKEDNKEKMKEHSKKWRCDNKEKKAEYNKQYFNDNKKQILEKVNEYRNANKEKTNQYSKDYYKNNKELQKVICDHCGCKVNKYGLKTHQKTKKCLKKQI